MILDCRFLTSLCLVTGLYLMYSGQLVLLSLLDISIGKCRKTVRTLSTAYNGETTHRKQQEQAVREAATICPRPSTPHAAAQHALRQRSLLPVAVGAMNIHDVRDRQTSDVRQTSDAHHRDGGIIMNADITLAATC